MGGNRGTFNFWFYLTPFYKLGLQFSQYAAFPNLTAFYLIFFFFFPSQHAGHSSKKRLQSHKVGPAHTWRAAFSIIILRHLFKVTLIVYKPLQQKKSRLFFFDGRVTASVD